MHLLPKEPVMLRDTTGQDRVIEQPNLWRRHRTLGVVLIVSAVALAILLISLHRFSGAGLSISRERLSIATVERGNFVRDVAADGQVVAAGSPTLYANVAGTVTLKVHAGDTVTKGQVLATIDSPDLTAKLSQEDATLQGLNIDWRRARLDAEHKLLELRDAYEQAQVDQKTAQRELDRSRKAYELGAYSELQALKAEDSLEKAKFAFAQAKMTYESQPEQNRFDIDSKKSLLDRQQFMVGDLKRQVESLTVRSPVDGQIGQVQIADRASVPKDAPLLTVVDLSALEVEIKIAESFARDLKPGMAADLAGDGRTWRGTVSGVSPEVVNGQVTTRIRFGDDKPAGLRQNQRLAVRILIDRRINVLMVDRGNFMDQEGSGFAYLVHDDVAERHPIRLGAASIAKVEVLDGLKEGDRIVVNGSDAFNNAERVILTH
jgi:HlyD family secretion protein